MFGDPFAASILRRAQEKGLIKIAVHNLRDHCTDKHRVTAGFGYKNFLGVPFLTLDTNVGMQLEETRDYGTGSLSGGGHTSAEVSSWHAGFGLTWNFM